MELVPRIAEDADRKRIEKIRQARLGEHERETLAEVPKSGSGAEESVRSRVIVAAVMGVSDRYVGLAKRVKEASPELFEDVRAGEVTLSEAIRRLEGTTDDVRATRVKAVRRPLNKLLRDVESPPAFLGRLEALVAEFAEP